MDWEKLIRQMLPNFWKIGIVALLIGIVYGAFLVEPAYLHACNNTKILNVSSLNLSQKENLIGKLPWNISNTVVIGFDGDNVIMKQYSQKLTNNFWQIYSTDATYLIASKIMMQTYNCSSERTVYSQIWNVSPNSSSITVTHSGLVSQMQIAENNSTTSTWITLNQSPPIQVSAGETIFFPTDCVSVPNNFSNGGLYNCTVPGFGKQVCDDLVARYICKKPPFTTTSTATTTTTISPVNWTGAEQCVNNTYKANLTYGYNPLTANATIQNLIDNGYLNWTAHSLKTEITGPYAFECGSYRYNFTNATNAYNLWNYNSPGWRQFWVEYCNTLRACAYLNRVK